MGFVDAQHRIIELKQMFRGTVTQPCCATAEGRIETVDSAPTAPG